MKKLILICLGVFISYNVISQTITATTTAQVIAALTAMETSQLNFGKFSPETQGGLILLSPEGVLTKHGTVILVSGTHSSASFYISGEPNAAFSIILPSGPSVLKNTLNSKIMIVKEWKSIPSAGVGVGKLIGGSMIIKVGATLNVGDINSNPVGIYTGLYDITFSYN